MPLLENHLLMCRVGGDAEQEAYRLWMFAWRSLLRAVSRAITESMPSGARAILVLEVELLLPVIAGYVDWESREGVSSVPKRAPRTRGLASAPSAPKERRQRQMPWQTAEVKECGNAERARD